MPTTPPPPATRSSSAFALWREAQDTRLRTRLGGIYYLIAWIFCWMFSADPGARAWQGGAITAFFVAMLAVRLAHRLPAATAPDVLHRWLVQHWAVLWTVSAGWGLACAGVIASPDFEPSRLIAILATIAFSTAMVFTFAMNLTRVLVAVALLYLPCLAVLAAAWPHQKAASLTLFFYFTYLLLAVRREHREYHANVATEYELIEQRERYQQLSRTDGLTQLDNRASFSAVFPVVAAQASRQAQPLVLALLDIDYFKRINDRHGHSAGDMCLRAFADTLRARFSRTGDVLARLGGEEFAVLVAGAEPYEVLQMVEGFREDLAQRRFEWAGESIVMTTSAGFGVLADQEGNDAEAFFQRVDRALYRAKEEGRNRTVWAEAGMPSSGTPPGPA